MMRTVPNESSGPRRPPLLWEQHCCLPLERCADVGELARYRRPGGSFVSVNVGYVPHSAEDVTGLIASWQHGQSDQVRHFYDLGVRTMTCVRFPNSR
ncbi:hypothetical protein ACWEQ3_11045 [Streptomyces mirabilis]|uniref:hypothetical protein n=1 Tax=Streptomyces mirabilis TaxID=68239 RepID=UPI0033A49C11